MGDLGGAAPFLTTLTVHAGRLAVCRLAPHDPLPAPDPHAPLWSVTRTAHELSAILPEDAAQPGWRVEGGWRCLEVAGPLDFGMTGVLHGLTGPLAAAGVPVCAISTYDTDYLLVREPDLARALAALEGAGHRIAAGPGTPPDGR